MNLYIIFGIITLITGLLFSTFVSSWIRANREIGFWLGDTEKMLENNIQNIITAKSLQKLQGLTGLTPLIARLVPFVLFYLGGINITYCIFGYIIFWFFLGVAFRRYIINHTSLLKVLYFNYNDLINRLADYKKNNDIMRYDAMKPIVEIFENINEFFQFLKDNGFEVKVSEIILWQDYINYICLEAPLFSLKDAFIKCFDVDYTLSSKDLSIIGDSAIIQKAREKLHINLNYYNILLYNPNFILNYISDEYNSNVAYNILCLDMKLQQSLNNDDKVMFSDLSEYINNLRNHLYDDDYHELNEPVETIQNYDKEINNKKIDEYDEDDVDEEFEFSYAKVKEVLRKIGYNNYATFKKEVYESKKIKRKKFDDKEKEVDYLVKALGYDDFEDFYYTNISNN